MQWQRLLVKCPVHMCFVSASSNRLMAIASSHQPQQYRHFSSTVQRLTSSVLGHTCHSTLILSSPALSTPVTGYSRRVHYGKGAHSPISPQHRESPLSFAWENTALPSFHQAHFLRIMVWPSIDLYSLVTILNCISHHSEFFCSPAPPAEWRCNDVNSFRLMIPEG